MKMFDAISEDQMVVSFLRGEFGSKRFGCNIAYRLNHDRQDMSVIFAPNLSDATENEYRKSLLDYRGYRNRTHLFHGFPTDVVWNSVELGLSDLRNLYVIGQDKWFGYTFGTRKIADALKYYYDNSEMEITEHIQHCLICIRNGGSFSEVILLGEDISKLVILEGHVRIMSYLINCDPCINVRGIVGLSENMST